MAYDYTRVTEKDPNDLSLVDSTLGWTSGLVFKKAYGPDVRKGITWSFERIAILLSDNSVQLNLNNHKLDELSNQMNQAVAAMTQDSEVKQSRMNSNGVVFQTLKERLDDSDENSGRIGNEVGTVDLDGGSLYVEGIDDESSPITIEVEKTVEEDSIPFGIETINVKDLGFETNGGVTNR